MNRKGGLHDWSLIGDTHYERQSLCSWNAHLDGCTVRSAASGGPIAVLVPENRSTVWTEKCRLTRSSYVPVLMNWKTSRAGASFPHHQFNRSQALHDHL
jgi:hypothetical protein